MLSHEQIELIQKELDKDSRSEFVEEVILRYIRDEDDMYHMLNFIPNVAQRMLEIKREELNRYRYASDVLVGSRSIDRQNRSKRKGKNSKIHNPDFGVLFHVCRACFPDGTCYEGDSASKKEFFEEFIETLKRKDGFDYDSPRDWAWVDKICDEGDWFKSVMKHNIDPDWKCPDEYL